MTGLKQEAPITLRGSASVAEILTGNPKYLKASLAQGRAHFFLSLWCLWWALANSSCMPNLKLLASAVAQILKANPKFWRAPMAQDHVHFFFGVGFYDGPWQTPAACQFFYFLTSAVAEIL